MKRTPSILLILALLTACGGGGAEPEAPRPVLGLASDDVDGLTDTYRAVLDCSGRVTLNGLSLNVGGTYTLESTPEVLTSPVHGLTGRAVRNAIRLTAVGQEVAVSLSEFVHNDAAGNWWSLGGEDETGTRSWWSDAPPTYYPAPVDETVSGRILNLHATMAVGQRIDVPATDALSDDLLTVLFGRTSTREVMGIEVLDTPLARFECYRVESTETIDLKDGSTPITVDYVRWERPDLGLVGVRISGVAVQYDTYDVVVERLDALIRSHTP